MLNKSIRLVCLLCFPLLAGCSSFYSNPMVQMMQHAIPQDAGVERAQFDPVFHYLRVETGESVIFMASDTPGIDAADVIGVWYSAGREVLRFQNGRLVAAVGMGAEWRNVVLPDLPAWSELARVMQPVKWTRIRDVMPGYRYGVRDELVLQRISPPAENRLKAVDARALVWFEERFDTQHSGSAMRQTDELPPARYAVDLRDAAGTVVYGEQCISAKLCFSWQRWPVRAEQKK